MHGCRVWCTKWTHEAEAGQASNWRKDRVNTKRGEWVRTYERELAKGNKTTVSSPWSQPRAGRTLVFGERCDVEKKAMPCNATQFALIPLF